METKKMSTSLSENMNYLNDYLSVGTNFDIVYRVIRIGGREACMYFIDGFCKDELMQKMLQYFMDIKEEEMPGSAHEMSKTSLPYVEVDLKDDWDQITYFIMSGVFALFVDGYDKCLLIDSRTYPARSVSEPEKDKVLRGSKDGFVETIVFNTALIRRRIRSCELRMEMLHAGNSSQTDIVLCYMDTRVDHNFLNKLKQRISEIQVDALTMNQESLAECLYKKKWYNPFPKFKFTERPDTLSPPNPPGTSCRYGTALPIAAPVRSYPAVQPSGMAAGHTAAAVRWNLSVRQAPGSAAKAARSASSPAHPSRRTAGPRPLPPAGARRGLPQTAVPRKAVLGAVPPQILRPAEALRLVGLLLVEGCPRRLPGIGPAA